MPKPRKRKRKKWIVILLILLAAGYGIWAKFFTKKEELLVVQVEKAARRDITETVEANGKIQPVTQVVISPEVAGEIIDLPVQEGQRVKKGALLVQIKPDNYAATKNSAEASYKYALGSRDQAQAELEKAVADFKRNEELFNSKLITASMFLEFKTTYEVAKLRVTNSIHQVDQAQFALDLANDDLAKTTIKAPIDGTVTKLRSQLGERVLGTSFNMGTEMMTIAQLDNMEARVDIGEIDIVLVQEGQNVRLDVDAFKDRTFNGTVTAIANSTRSSGTSALTGSSSSSSNSQEAPKFEVRIRINDKEAFRPGMSVTAEIETRSRKDTLAVLAKSVTTRLPPGSSGGPAGGKAAEKAAPASAEAPGEKVRKAKAKEPVKPIEVVFVHEGDHVKMVPVKTGISDGDYSEITSGLTEGDEVVSGGYKAVAKDLEDGKKVTIGPPTGGGKEGK